MQLPIMPKIMSASLSLIMIQSLEIYASETLTIVSATKSETVHHYDTAMSYMYVANIIVIATYAYKLCT